MKRAIRQKARLYFDHHEALRSHARQRWQRGLPGLCSLWRWLRAAFLTQMFDEGQSPNKAGWESCPPEPLPAPNPMYPPGERPSPPAAAQELGSAAVRSARSRGRPAAPRRTASGEWHCLTHEEGNHLSETHVSSSESLEEPKLLALKSNSSYFVTSPCPDVLKPSVLSAIFVPLLAIQYALIRTGMIPDELVPQRLSPERKKKKECIPSAPAHAEIKFSPWLQTVIFGEVERGTRDLVTKSGSGEEGSCCCQSFPSG